MRRRGERGHHPQRLMCFLLAGLGMAGAAHAQGNAADAIRLPEAPSAVMMARADVGDGGLDPMQGPTGGTAGAHPPPKFCKTRLWLIELRERDLNAKTCVEDPIQMIVGEGPVAPLSPKQKAELAARNVVSPGNLATVAAYSGIYVAAESHSPYGPGFPGFGRLVGYSLAEDTQGEFFGVYAIPSLVHEDPRYHRMPNQTVSVRILHALSHTVITRHDDGTLMPNYATLLTYPISAYISNGYVPGINTSGSSTRDRILLGYATDPAGALVAEFLPDVARRIHIRVVFVQQILNQIVATKSNAP